MIANNQEKQTVVQLKKVYNVFSNAFSLAVIEYGEPNSWGWTANGSLVGAKNAFDKFQPYLNITKRCDGTKGCFPKGVFYKWPNGENKTIVDDSTNTAKGILADGTIFNIYAGSNGCLEVGGTSEALKNTCGIMAVDINGFKGPNKIGSDLFNFWVSEKGIIPEGTPDDTSYNISSCKSTGRGCTAWVLINENLNYPPAGTDWNGNPISTP